MQWEYKFVRVSNAFLVVDVLNGYGKDGWEAISISEKKDKVYVYCKRPLDWY